MADSECKNGNSSISGIECDERNAEPVQFGSSDSNTGAKQFINNTQLCDAQSALNVSDISLTNQNKYGDETNTEAELLHGDVNEHNGTDPNAEVGCVKGEILITNMPLEEEAGKETDCQTVSQIKHFDTTLRAEEKQRTEAAPQETTSAETDQEINYSLQEYKFENSSQITSAWKEFKKKEDICMKGCKWYVYIKLEVIFFYHEGSTMLKSLPYVLRKAFVNGKIRNNSTEFVCVTQTDVICNLICCITLVHVNMLIFFTNKIICFILSPCQ
jgi:hypothetical protein